MKPCAALPLVTLALLAAGCAGALPDGGDADAPAGPDGAASLEGPAWKEHAPAPVPIAEVAVAVRGAEAWLVGGFASPVGGSPTVLVYDMGNDTWRAGPSYPLPVHHAQAAWADGRLHVFGGYVGGVPLPGSFVPGAGPAGWPRTALSFVLDPDVGRWEPLPDLPEARAAGGAAVLDGRIHLVGGAGAEGYLPPVHVYDPADRTYAEAAALPEPRDHLTVLAHEGRIYALAGRANHGEGWDDMEAGQAYDPAQDAWVALPPAPLGRGGQAGAPWRGMLPLFGGERAEGEFTVYDDAHAYDPARQAWVDLPRLPTPRHGMAAAAWEDRVYLMGGASESDLLATVVSLGPSA